jgi:hypothetical protein
MNHVGIKFLPWNLSKTPLRWIRLEGLVGKRNLLEKDRRNLLSPGKRSICYQSFHVPGDDERSLFREKNQQNIFNLLDEIAEPLNSPTYAFKTLDETREFVTANNLVFDSKMTRPFYLTEVSLLCGWYMALVNFLSNDFDYMIIFEDDMWVSDEPKKVSNFLSILIGTQMPEDTDCLNLYVTDVEMNDYRPEYRMSEYISKGYNYYCCGMLVITKTGAEKLLSTFKNTTTKAMDLIMFQTPELGLRYYCLNPTIQREYFSMWARNWLGSTIDPKAGNFSSEFWEG